MLYRVCAARATCQRYVVHPLKKPMLIAALFLIFIFSHHHHNLEQRRQQQRLVGIEFERVERNATHTEQQH